MDAFFHAGLNSEQPRDHPYVCNPNDPRSQYYDFKVRPDFIEEALEDFLPFRETPASKTFYELLRWINSPDSLLESNDCGFLGPHDNSSPDYPRPREASGRLMIFYRELELNTMDSALDGLTLRIQSELKRIDPEFRWGAVRLAYSATTFHYLEHLSIPAVGRQLVINFWSWGETDGEVLENLNRVFTNVFTALRNAENNLKSVLGASIDELRDSRVTVPLFNVLIHKRFKLKGWNSPRGTRCLKHLSAANLLCDLPLDNLCYIGSGNIYSIITQTPLLCPNCEFVLGTIAREYLSTPDEEDN